MDLANNKRRKRFRSAQFRKLQTGERNQKMFAGYSSRTNEGGRRVCRGNQ
jgi:hypothetical protein